MNKTLLIDLDDTLIGNNMDRFIPAYLGKLGEHLAAYTPPTKMAQVMLAATQKMFENKQPNRTLKEAFDPHFYPVLGLVESEMRGVLTAFYRDIFPELKASTQPFPQTPGFIKDAIRQGYSVGIATNPLFPRTAITQRMDWAGIAEADFDFCLIPSYETFHFAKPNPAYYAEFLTRIGWPEGPVVMVGNDLDHDIRGAQQLGIPAYWVENTDQPNLSEVVRPEGRGQLTDFFAWMAAQPEERLKPNFSDPTVIQHVLRGSAAAIYGQLKNISPEAWVRKSSQGEWSLTEIVCHLRDVEREINLPRVVTTLTETNPFISGVDSDAWASERNYARQNGPAALEKFIGTRIELLGILEKFSPNDWKRPLRHAIFGPTHLQEIIRISCDHERLHGRQIYHSLNPITH